MGTMNFRSKAAGIHRDTFMKAVQAEGLPMANHLSAVIANSARLQWKNYRRPRPPWLSNLRRSKVIYRGQDVPGACYKFEHALELLFRFYKPMRKPWIASQISFTRSKTKSMLCALMKRRINRKGQIIKRKSAKRRNSDVSLGKPKKLTLKEGMGNWEYNRPPVEALLALKCG